MKDKQALVHSVRRARKDRIVGIGVTFFGVSILGLLVIIIWHLVSHAAPLFYQPNLELQQSLKFPEANLLSAGDVLDGGAVITTEGDCGLALVRNINQNKAVERYIAPCSHRLAVVEARDKRWLFDISDKGIVRVRSVDHGHTQFSFALPESTWQQRQAVDISVASPHVIIKVTTAELHHVFSFNENQPAAIASSTWPSENKLLLMPGTQQVLGFSGSAMTIKALNLATQTTYREKGQITWAGSIDYGHSIYVATQRAPKTNVLTRWVITNHQGKFVFSPTYTLSLQSDEVPISVKAHSNSNAGVLLTNKKRLLLFNRVTGEPLNQQTLLDKPSSISWHGDRLYLVYANDLQVMKLVNVAGIASLKELFQAQQYEGYAQPEHVYQTTSGSDFHEAKYALIPLLMGSFKAASLAFLVAIPISLGAAIYTGFFARRTLRNKVKPVIEMLEAVPSVVLGFIAAVLLAPLADSVLVAVMFFVLTAPLFLIGTALFQHRITQRIAKQWRYGTEVFVAMVGILIWAKISAMVMASVAPLALFGGLSKTTLIVSLALGLAISPTIYTLAEDAIDSVPRGLKSASFALGATRLQTLKNIVLKVAMPGLVAASMLGFGRAFGETMIVLMVTGNTPIPSWDIFESLRALTANLAIELPEADSNSALYSVLFLTALLLFLFTFLINSIAEVLRQRVRRNTLYE